MIIVHGKEIFTTLEELVNPRHTALLLIDLQNDYMMPGGYFDKLADCSAIREIVPPIKRVLEAARQSHVLVVYVQMTFYPDFLAESPVGLYRRLLRIGSKSANSVEKLLPYCVEGTWGWQIVDELAPLSNEIVVKKHCASAFIGTSLDMILRGNGIKCVNVVGLVTHGCVMSTGIDASFFDYYTVVLRNCVADPNQTFHDAAILLMSHTRDVVDSREVLEIWQKSTSGEK